MSETQEKPKPFVIQRDKWRFGSSRIEGFGPVYLLNKKGYKCCLGFVASQLGMEDSQIQGKVRPSDVILNTSQTKQNHPLQSVLVDCVQGVHCGSSYYDVSDNQLTDECIEINDDPDLTLMEREQALISAFAKKGLELVFEGKYSQAQLDELKENWADPDKDLLEGYVPNSLTQQNVNMSQYTSTPWIVCVNSVDDAISIEQDGDHCQGDPTIIIMQVDDMGQGLDRATAMANAQRIVDCVNACTDIDPNQLESLLLVLQELQRHIEDEDFNPERRDDLCDHVIDRLKELYRKYDCNPNSISQKKKAEPVMKDAEMMQQLEDKVFKRIIDALIPVITQHREDLEEKWTNDSKEFREWVEKKMAATPTYGNQEEQPAEAPAKGRTGLENDRALAEDRPLKQGDLDASKIHNAAQICETQQFHHLVRLLQGDSFGSRLAAQRAALSALRRKIVEDLGTLAIYDNLSGKDRLFLDATNSLLVVLDFTKVHQPQTFVELEIRSRTLRAISLFSHLTSSYKKLIQEETASDNWVATPQPPIGMTTEQASEAHKSAALNAFSEWVLRDPVKHTEPSSTPVEKPPVSHPTQPVTDITEQVEQLRLIEEYCREKFDMFVQDLKQSIWTDVKVRGAETGRWTSKGQAAHSAIKEFMERNDSEQDSASDLG